MSGSIFDTRGLSATPQNEVNIFGQFNRTLANTLRKSGVNGISTLYPIGSDECFSVIEKEIVYVPKAYFNENNKYSPRQYIPVLSTLNGQGQGLKQLFPDNPAMQIEAIWNEIKIIGSARDSMLFDSDKSRNGDFGVQVKGVHNGWSTGAVLIGQKMEYFIEIDEGTSGNGRKQKPNGIPQGKITIGLRPFVPRIASDKIVTTIREVIYSSKEWSMVMNKKYKSTQSYLTMTDAFLHNSQMNGLLFLERLFPFFLRSYKIDENEDLSDEKKEEKKQQLNDLWHLSILDLASKLSVLDSNVNTFDSKLEADTPNETHFFQMSGEEANEFQRQYLMACFWDGRVADFGFGFSNKEKNKENLRGVSVQQKKLDLESPYGNMLSKQINMPNKFLSAITETLRKSFERIAGTAIRPAVNAGDIVSYLN